MKLDTKLKVALICSLDKSIIRQRSELTQPPSEQECNTCYCVTYKDGSFAPIESGYRWKTNLQELRIPNLL